MERTELIGKVAKALHDADCGCGEAPADRHRNMALVAVLAVFEEQQKPSVPCMVCGREDGTHKMSCRPQNRIDAQKPSEDEREALHREATSRAETAYPALNDDDELLSYPRAALRQHKRGAYITGFTDGAARRPVSPETAHTFDSDACVTRECDCAEPQAKPTDALDPQPWEFISDQVFGVRSAVDKGFHSVSGAYYVFQPRPGYEQDRARYEATAVTEQGESRG